MNKNVASGPAFHIPAGTWDSGLSRREWFAARAPVPTEDYIKHQIEADRAANPHNDSYKPQRRSRLEIECDYRYAWADAMLAAGEREGR